MSRSRVVEIEGLEAMAAAFDRLGRHALADAVQEALNDVAAASVGGMKDEFDRRIEGGPVAFSEIRPGQKNSSVVSSRRRGATKGTAEATVSVQRRQSAYLKFALGEDDDREPGDAGAASEFNFIPVADMLKRHQGISLTAEGNLPRNSLRTLVRRAQSQRTRDRNKLKKKKAPGVSAADLDTFRISRKKRLGLRRKDAFVGTKKQRQNDIFFGKRNGRTGAQGKVTGFWQRPVKRVGAPRLLVGAVPRSVYRDDALVLGWNKAVLTAADDVPRVMRKRLAEILDGRLVARAAKRRR